MVAILLATFVIVCSAFAQTDSISDSSSSVTEWGNVEIESEISADSLPQNDTLEFTIRVKIYGNPDDYAMADPGNPTVSNLKLRGASQANRTEGVNNEIVLFKEYRYSYTPMSIGMAYINPVRMQYVYVPNGTSHDLATNRLEIKITESVLPPKRIKIVPIIALVAAILIGGGIIVWLVLRSRKKPEIVEDVFITPEQKTRDSLRDLRKSFAGEPERLINEQAKLIKEYFDERYRECAETVSDEELLECLERKGVPGTVLTNLSNALLVCNQVRFAGHSASRADAETVELGLESLLSYNEKPKEDTDDIDKTDEEPEKIT
ncbi:hypothetical protein DRQ36_03875 [bacterium]|nr:MAG: hypothetical protein DRQ36_03875 [bacterium]